MKQCERCGVEHPDSETHEEALARLEHAYSLALTHGVGAAARDLQRTLAKMRGK